MAIQKFTLDAIQKLRNAVQAELAIAEPKDQVSLWSDAEINVPEPESLDDLSDIFAFGGRSEAEQTELVTQNQWSVSTFNPASVLLKLPGLWVKPDYRLVGFLYRAAPNGAGIIFALPAELSTTAHLQKALAQATVSKPPRPEGAMPHFMAAIDGDRSAASFMVASLLRRELQEFGAIGNRCNWNHHRLIQALPNKLLWQWRTEVPKDWLPKAMVMPDGQAAVEFFSCRVEPQEVVLYRHVDRYLVDGYQPISSDKALAVAKRG